MKIDIHSHFIPQQFLDLLIAGKPELQAKIVTKGDIKWVAHDQGYTYPLLPGFYDLIARLQDMEKAQIDMAVISNAPPLFYYWASIDTALNVARLVNDSIAELVKAYPDKFRGMATVPMQDIDCAIAELRRCVNELGFKAVQIGANIEGTQFDEPYFLPFFKACEELGVVVSLHPYYVGAKGAFSKYYLTNLYGNPLDSAVAAASLIFGGVLDNCPNLKVCLAHGGGFFPYQLGRLEHGFKVRTEPKIQGCKSPSYYLDQLYFDSILFATKPLRFLVDMVGAEHVLMGTDYPFDMGENEPIKFIESSKLSPVEEKFLLTDNARKLFNI